MEPVLSSLRFNGMFACRHVALSAFPLKFSNGSGIVPLPQSNVFKSKVLVVASRVDSREQSSGYNFTKCREYFGSHTRR